MADVFGSLSRSLSDSERQDMLSRLKTSSIVQEEPLVDEQEHTSFNVDEEYHKLSIIEKIIIFFKKLFNSGMSKEALVKERVLKKYAARIQSQFPALYSAADGTLLPGLYQHLLSLQEGITYFSELLNKLENKKNGEFYALVHSLEYPEIHERLQKESDPSYQAQLLSENLSSNASEIDDKNIKRAIDALLDDVFEFMPQDTKTFMYDNARMLGFLQRLNSFSFLYLNRRFAHQEKSIKLDSCLDDLENLASVLYSCNSQVHQTLIEALIINVIPENTGSNDTESIVMARAEEANVALNKIRSFTQKVPLVSFVKLGRKNLDFFPHPSGSGENWFYELRAFWKEKSNTAFEQYTANIGIQKIESEIKEITGGTGFDYIDGYEIAFDGNVIRGRYAISIGYIKTFAKTVFAKKMNPVLKAILMEAEFYKRENRNQFTNAYSYFLKIRQDVKMVEDSMKHGTPLFADLQNLTSQKIPEELQQARYYSFLTDVDKKIKNIISDSILFSDTMEKVLEGILFGKSGKAFDSITNLGNIKGNSNKEFITSLTQVLQDFQTFKRLLANIFEIEKKVS